MVSEEGSMLFWNSFGIGIDVLGFEFSDLTNETVSV
jgi:hypothetical protein